MKKITFILLLSLAHGALLPGSAAAPTNNCIFVSAPTVHFKKNSVEYATESKGADAAAAIEVMRKLLTDNPKMVIELMGNCDAGEKNPAKLSQERADKVKAALVKLGIAKERLVAKGYGITKLLVKPDAIKKEMKEAEKEAMRARNRRCVYNIINQDSKEN